YDFLINGVICFILTSSALNFKVSDLRHHWRPISILAGLALVCCAGFYGMVLYGSQSLVGQHVHLLVSLLLGAASAATDAICIKGIVRSIRALNDSISNSDSESIVNDAMCIYLIIDMINVFQRENFPGLVVLPNFH